MAGKRNGTFSFDLSQPVKKGVLLKQGAFHKAFKYRFFIVYPGFLVYYDQESKWRYDLTIGETLGSRLGAIKLKGGSCSVARDAPKACKFGFIIHAPDPLNKRPTYLINANSKQDRDEWIEAIKKSTPISPHQRRKTAGAPNKMKDQPKKAEPDPLPPHPSKAIRQDTAAEAATLATENERLHGVDESITSIDDSLQPTLDVRRDTASSAVLSLSSKAPGEVVENLEEDDRDTSIDDILGPRENEDDCKDSDTSDGSIQRTPTPSDSNSIQAHSPEPEAVPVSDEGAKSTDNEQSENTEPKKVEEEGEKSESSPMESSEKVENQTTNQGSVEVVTSVTVEVNGEAAAVVCDGTLCKIRKNDEKGTESSEAEGESQEAKELTSEEALERDSSESTSADEKAKEGWEEQGEGVEVLISQDQRSNSFSVNVANVDTDEYSSSEDESTQPPPYVEPPSSSSVTEANATPTQEVTSCDELTKVNGECPAITVEKAEGEKGGQGEEGKEKRSGSDSSSEGGKLSPPPEKRRSSQPFIEKKGFLYKMGGKRKNWNLRYFVLRPGVFTYAKNPSTKILGEVKLKNLQVFFPGIGERKTSFQFTIHTESTWNKRNDWVLAAQSEREMKDWIVAFKLAGQKNMPSPATSDNELGSS